MKSAQTNRKSPRRLHCGKTGDVPNSPLPALLFRSVLAASRRLKAEAFRKIFRQNGWVGIWTDTIYDYTHFHSNAHEVLGIAEGKVTLRIGGETGRLLKLEAGDMLVLPAGVGHRRVSHDERLRVVGAYPRGQAHFDMKRKGRRVPRVALPQTDPIEGENGAVPRIWREESSGGLWAR
jgi:uncharacterized protein YjlB